MKKTLFALLMPAFLGVFAGLQACGKDHSTSGGEVIARSTLQLALKYSATNRFDSLVVHGEGADTVHYRLDVTENSLNMELYPALWKFTAKLYAGGKLMQKGEAEIEIESGETAYLQMQLQALFGFVDVKIPLGLGNPAGIARGVLTLTSKDSVFKYNLVINEPFAYFESEALPLETWYTVTMELYNAQGEVVYKANDTLFLSRENATVNWSLSSLKGSLSMEILQDSMSAVSVNVNYLARALRTPKAQEVLFSEIQPIPQSGTNFEFIEFYNATIDTLVLDSCQVKLRASNNGVVTIPAGARLLPASYLAIGADSTEFLHPASWYSSGLTNTRAALLLVCEGVVIDSIAYSATVEPGNDSIFVKSSSSTHLDLSNWQMHDNGRAWCIGEATPGYAQSCYVEEDDSGDDVDM